MQHETQTENKLHFVNHISEAAVTKFTIGMVNIVTPKSLELKSFFFFFLIFFMNIRKVVLQLKHK